MLRLITSVCLKGLADVAADHPVHADAVVQKERAAVTWRHCPDLHWLSHRLSKLAPAIRRANR